jgi:hypothetical protein
VFSGIRPFSTSGVTYRTLEARARVDVPTRIKTNFKFQNFVNVDWFIHTEYTLIVDLRRTLYFDTRINRKYVNLKTHLQAAHAHRYVTIRAKWKTAFSIREGKIQTKKDIQQKDDKQLEDRGFDGEML